MDAYGSISAKHSSVWGSLHFWARSGTAVLLAQDNLVQGKPFWADPVASPLARGRRNARQGVGWVHPSLRYVLVPRVTERRGVGPNSQSPAGVCGRGLLL